jgi:ribosome-dependent ATPase
MRWQAGMSKSAPGRWRMPQRAETVQGYVGHAPAGWPSRPDNGWRTASQRQPANALRYNPDVKACRPWCRPSMPLLLLLPAMLTRWRWCARRKLGSITNLYVTPVTRTEFLLGKQLPYVGLAMLNFLLMSLLAVTVFGVPVTGSFLTLAGSPDLLLHLHRHGLLASSSPQPDRRDVLAMIGTIIPATQFSG